MNQTSKSSSASKAMNYIIAIIFLFGNWNMIYGQHHDNHKLDLKKRELKKNEIISSLKAFQPNTETPILELKETDIDQSIKKSIRISGEGFLQLNETNWIYFISSSSHSDASIGDMTLAIDQLGNIYQNDGHVCGGIVHFQTFERSKIKNSAQFFQLFKSDTDDIGWSKL
jgi:hypothetical protein